jgi:hypothetical protein
MQVLIPAAIKVGVIVGLVAFGHLTGWIHHEISNARAQKRKEDELHKALQSK